MIKARVNIETANHKYKPGDVIKEKLSDADMAFLKKHNFIISDESDFPDENVEVDTEYEIGLNTDDAEDTGDDDPGMEYKDGTVLQKMKKEEIVEYAASIGLELDETALKNDLIDAVLNYIEEKAAQ